MDYHNFLRTRRSIRRFKPDPIPDSVIRRILATATYAPSAHNRQPWRFAVLTSIESKSRLADAMAGDFRRDLEKDELPESEISARLEKSRTRINLSPVVIVLCMDTSEMDPYPDSRRSEAERVMAIQSTANAGLQVLLAAHAEGFCGVWTCGPLFAPEVVVKTLNLPEAWIPQAMFFIGQADETPRSKILKTVEEISIWQ